MKNLLILVSLCVGYIAHAMDGDVSKSKIILPDAQTLTASFDACPKTYDTFVKRIKPKVIEDLAGKTIVPSALGEYCAKVANAYTRNIPELREISVAINKGLLTRVVLRNNPDLLAHLRIHGM